MVRGGRFGIVVLFILVIGNRIRLVGLARCSGLMADRIRGNGSITRWTGSESSGGRMAANISANIPKIREMDTASTNLALPNN